MNNQFEDAAYTCQMCYLSDLDHLNPIVFCGHCSLGSHQRCYGIQDLEADFNCDRCVEFIMRQRKQKNKKRLK
jgi:hypothetical protein